VADTELRIQPAASFRVRFLTGDPDNVTFADELLRRAAVDGLLLWVARGPDGALAFCSSSRTTAADRLRSRWSCPVGCG
jgi:hypothetical protein